MGWCSGTDVFDHMMFVIKKTDITDEQRQCLIQCLIVALQNQDWDCESDSDYWRDPLVRKAFKEVCPKWDWKEIEEMEKE